MDSELENRLKRLEDTRRKVISDLVALFYNIDAESIHGIRHSWSCIDTDLFRLLSDKHTWHPLDNVIDQLERQNKEVVDLLSRVAAYPVGWDRFQNSLEAYSNNLRRVLNSSKFDYLSWRLYNSFYYSARHHYWERISRNRAHNE